VVFGTLVQEKFQDFGAAKWNDILALLKLPLKSLHRLSHHNISVSKVLKIGVD